METMYDKLGELLSETLTEGKVNKKYQKVSFDKGKSDENEEKDKSKEKIEETKKEKKENFFNRKDERKGEREGEREEKITHISPKIIRACHLLDITVSASKEDVKKAYKEKIKYYHPDKYEKNPVLRSVANKKTKMIVEAYDLLLKSFT